MEYTLNGKYLDVKIKTLFIKDIQSFFDEYIPSKKIQHLLIQNKWILIDRQPCKREDKLNGKILSINIYPNINNYVKKNYNLDVVYEDEICLVVNKPKDLLVHSDGTLENTLTDMVESYYFDKPFIDVQPLNRLDKDTSGLVVYSKSEIFQPLLDKLLFNKLIRRSYLAFVKGTLKKDYSFKEKILIGRDRHNPKRMAITNNGDKAVTKFKVLGSKNNISVVRCILETGRTHQIRLQLSHLGYPILNDVLYGSKDNNINRMGLVADEIEFYHPLKEENMKIEIELPNDLLKLYNDLL